MRWMFTQVFVGGPLDGEIYPYVIVLNPEDKAVPKVLAIVVTPTGRPFRHLYEGDHYVRANGDTVVMHYTGAHEIIVARDGTGEEGWNDLRLGEDGYWYLDPSVVYSLEPLRWDHVVMRQYGGPPPFDGAEVVHEDGDKGNNAFANLRYETPEEYRERTGHEPEIDEA